MTRCHLRYIFAPFAFLGLFVTPFDCRASAPPTTTFYLGTVSGPEEVERDLGPTVFRKVERDQKAKSLVSAALLMAYGRPMIETLHVDFAAKTARKSRRRSGGVQDIACELTQLSDLEVEVAFVVRCAEDGILFVERHAINAEGYALEVAYEDAATKRKANWTLRFSPTAERAFAEAIQKRFVSDANRASKSLEELMADVPSPASGQSPRAKSLDELSEDVGAKRSQTKSLEKSPP